MSLAVAAWRDMILKIIQDRHYIALKNQTAKVSRKGLNLKQRKECADRAEENFIDRCCEALEKGDIEAEVMLETQPGKMFVPNKKAKHKVPEVLSNNNHTQKRKSTNAKSKTQNNNIQKKGMKTTNTRKRPHIEISDTDDTDTGDDVFGTVPKDVEEKKLATNSPHIVLINVLIQKCSGCKFKFTTPERQ